MKVPLIILCAASLLHAQAPVAPEVPQAEQTPGKTAAEPADNKPEAVKIPAVTKLENGKFKVGEVTLDPKTREIFVPCTVNMNEGTVEFAIVHETGKVHEALLATKVTPTMINLAFKLLRYVESHELFPLPRERFEMPVEFPVVSEEVRKGARVDLNLEWQVEGKTKKAALAEWLSRSENDKHMQIGPWVYGGSMMYDGKFIAETTGDIASISVASAAILLYTGEDDNNDEMWNANQKVMPAKDTPVTLIISPHFR